MTLRETRALFAHCLLGGLDLDEPVSLGSIALRRHQLSAIKRANAAFEEFGGALLSDHVGTGKTYVALALAAAAGEATVVAPAVLKDMWTAAAANAQVRITFLSTESLSRDVSPGRARPPSVAGSIVIVDEAQHFRNPSTRRFASLAHRCSDQRVLLLSATPIHNKRRDLGRLLALFLGSRALHLSASEMGRVVIRRNRDDIKDSAPMPQVETPEWCDLTHDDEIPELLLSLPPPLSPRNGGDGGALVVHSLVRQWISSDAALYRALLRRLQKCTALISALESGSYPSNSELATWIAGEDCVQLGFAELMAPPTSESPLLLPIVRAHAAAIQALTQRLKLSNRRDLERAKKIRELRGRHGGVPIVAFSQYADTVEEMFDLLAPGGAVAVLTGDGARVAGGRISRAEAIGRFAPHASGKMLPRASDAVTLLLTTDILSEGVNLQDAGVVIHLDLPWTPARLEQRLGRVARMGSFHERVFSYVMRPPASADSLIQTERILREKMVSAGIVTDGLESILPGTFVAPPDENLPAVIEEFRSVLRRWSSDAFESAPSGFIASAVTAPINGFIALVRTSVGYMILANDSGGVTDDPARALAMMRLADAQEITFSVADLNHTIVDATRHLLAASAVGTARAPSHPHQSPRRDALRRIAQIAGSARPHERLQIVVASSRARERVLGRLSAGQETRLAALSDQQLPDGDWLREVTALTGDARASDDPHEIIAVILFRTATL